MITAPHMQTAAQEPGGAAPFDVERIRGDFPVLAQAVNGRPLVYLDNAATTQKPRCVIEAVGRYYERDNANIHRGVHALSMRATEAYEQARAKVQRFIGAARPESIVFVRGTTEAINLVANSYVRPRLRAGDEILITEMEHHSNIVPWQILCQQTGAVLRAAPISDAGELRFDEFVRLLGPRTKLVAVCHTSNALGTVNPVRRMVEASRAHGAAVLLDGAQAVPHGPVNVKELDCDFFAFSAHKMYGPTGVGALYAKKELLDEMPPYQGGGDMIKSVSLSGTVYNDVPHKFEAGTPDIAGVIGFGTAVDYLREVGLERIAAYEAELLEYATAALSALPQVRLIGTAREKAAVVSFLLDDIHPHDVGTVLDQQGIAVRTGHHCAQPVMERFGIPATVRASLAFYNTREEIDALAEGLRKTAEVFA